MSLEIKLPPYGDAPDDNKGIDLRNAVMMYNESIQAIVDWISGAPNTKVLTNIVLNQSRGGTGGATALRGRLGLGLFVDTNNNVKFGARAVSLYNGTVLDHDLTVKPVFNKVGLGHYTLGKVSGFALNGFTYSLPRDELGNLLCTCVITFDDTIATVKVYAVKYVNGQAQIDLTTPMDIPDTRCIDISVK